MTELKAKSIPNSRKRADAPVPAPVTPDAARSRPYLARHPEVGYAVFLISTLAFILLTVLVLTKSPLLAWDAPLARSIHDWAARQPVAVELFMRFISYYGRDGVALMMFILAVGWIRKGARRELWLLIFGALGAQLWFHILTNLFDRARPEFRDPHETLLGAGYPSGHAATSVVLAGIVLYLLLPYLRRSGARPAYRAGLVAAVVLVVILIIFSRLFLSMHYPTDLLGGTLLGLGWGAMIFTITERAFWKMDVDSQDEA